MKVGDRVRVIVQTYENNDQSPHFREIGIITLVSTICNRPACAVERDGRIGAIWYYQSDLELLDVPAMMDPEFSLDEMAEGEEIISQMD